MKKIPRYDFTFDATGTKWHITIPLNPGYELIDEKVKARIKEYENTYSRFKEDSLIAKIAAAPGEFVLGDDAKQLLDIYFKMYELTEGKFTPLIGKTLVEAGYDAKYSLTPHTISDLPVLHEVLDYRFPVLRVKEPVQMDIGAAGKGYLIDIVADLLIKEGIKEFTIDAGGDIFHSAYKAPLEVALEHPLDPDKAIGVATINNIALCASSGNRRKWKNFHHIIDPQLKESPQDVLATWVTAEHAITADAIATALFLVEPEALHSAFKFEYLILNRNLAVNISKGFPAQIFYA